MDGVYELYVSNSAPSSDEYDFANTNARVDAYIGDEFIESYDVPESGVFDTWYVCDYDSQTKTFVNRNEIVHYSTPSEQKNIISSECSPLYDIRTTSGDGAIKSWQENWSSIAIEISGSKDWNEIADQLELVTLKGYSATYLPADEDYPYGRVCVMRGMRDLITLQIRYEKVDALTVEGEHLTKYGSNQWLDFSDVEYTCVPGYWAKANGNTLYIYDAPPEAGVKELCTKRISFYESP